MAIDLPTFRALYPEFAQAPDTLVQGKLNEATQLVPAFVWNCNNDPTRDLTQQATFLYCAHFLYESPFARHMASTDTEDGAGHRPTSPYLKRLRTLQRIVTSGYRVL